MGGWIKGDPPRADSSHTRFFHSHKNRLESSKNSQFVKFGSTVRKENKAGTRRVTEVVAGHGRVDTMLGEKSKLRRDKRGAVAVEYAMILVMFVIPSTAAISYEGRLVYSQYKEAKGIILLPVP